MKQIKSTTYTVAELASLFDKKLLTIDYRMQRKQVYKEKTYLELINCVVNGGYLPALVLVQTTDGFELFDGQQRFSMLYRYYNSLSAKHKLEFGNTNIRVDVLSSKFFLSSEEKALAFYNMNNGHTPSKPEQMRRAKQYKNAFFAELLRFADNPKTGWQELTKLHDMFDNIKRNKMLDEKLLCEIISSIYSTSYVYSPSKIDLILEAMNNSLNGKINFKQLTRAVEDTTTILQQIKCKKKTRLPFLTLCLVVHLYLKRVIPSAKLIGRIQELANSSNLKIAKTYRFEETNGARFQEELYHLVAKSIDLS